MILFCLVLAGQLVRLIEVDDEIGGHLWIMI